MSNTIYEQYQKLKETEHLYVFDAAKAMGISEGELVAHFPGTIYLGHQAIPFIESLEALGQVKSIVRNEVAVHEKGGIVKNLQLSPVMGVAINLGGLDLRFFIKRWKHIFAVTENNRLSFQVFDAYGQIIQKIFLLHNEPKAVFDDIVAKFKVDETPQFLPREEKEPYVIKNLSAEKIQSFREKWLTLTDVHAFRNLLSDFDIDRLEGLQYAPEGDCIELQVSAIESLLQRCVSEKLTLLCFVNNSGLVQIQTGPVHHVVRSHGYLNILDGKTETEFSLHLKDSEIDSVWLVRRPSINGLLHSIEGYTKDRELVIQFFGRAVNVPTEPVEWMQCLQDLGQTHAKK